MTDNVAKHLPQLKLQPGDVVECWYNYGRVQSLTERKLYTIESDGLFVDDVGKKFKGESALFRIHSRAADAEPKQWQHMTAEEKGALLLAEHEGKTIEFCTRYQWYEAEEKLAWLPDCKYRIKKPAPVVETVTLYLYRTVHSATWYADAADRSEPYKSPYRITLDTVDGVPDFSTLKGSIK